MKLSVDNQQRVTALFTMIIELYKVAMGTFLTVFVPQDCGYGVVCSIQDNIQNTALFRRILLGLNAFTFLSILSLYFIELRRENWSITYLDINPSKPNNNLDSEIEEYPKIKEEMLIQNNTYIDVFYVSCALLAVNFCASSIVVIQDNAGMVTITSLIGFLILISNKMYTVYDVGTKSIESERAFSAYLTIPRTYNTIDEDYRNCKQKGQELEDTADIELSEMTEDSN